jgi:hypothetical protein
MFIKTSKKIQLVDSDVRAFEKLPNGVYLTKYNKQMDEYFLEETAPFITPSKIYGNSNELSDRYVNTFNKGNKNMGILLTGLKGTGKSLTAKLTCIKSNIPVILITEPFCDDTFKGFLNSLTQEVVIFIDEFEKVYNDIDEQNALLSLLDGVFEGKKLFLFTSNATDNINKFMINRPGRIRYLSEYESLDYGIINEVIDDTLINKLYKDEMLDVMDILGVVSMDILVGLIDEVNTYSESPKVAASYLNIRPERNQYSVTIFKDNIKNGSTSTKLHPLTINKTTIEYFNIERLWEDIEIDMKEWDLIKDGKKVIMVKDEFKVIFEPQLTNKFAF